MKRLLQLLKKRFLTSKGHATLEQEVAFFCNHSGVCQVVKPRRKPPPETLDYYPLPECPFSSHLMDFLSLESNPITVDNHTYHSMFIVVCRLTGYILIIPFNTHITAEELARHFLQQVVCFFGLPQEVYSDQDHLVNSKFFQTYAQMSGIESVQSSAHQSQANARAENAVQLAICSLRKVLVYKQATNWLELLPLALWCLNDLPGPAGLSAHRLVFGRVPIVFGECPPVSVAQGSEDARTFFQRLVYERAPGRN